MALNMEYISAEIAFIAESGDSAASYIYPKSSGREIKRPINEKKVVRIHDARCLEVSSTLEVNGFQLLNFPTRITDFYDERDIADNYYREAIELLKEVTGATEVFVFDHTYRSEVRANAGQQGVRMPAEFAHVDYTPRSGPRRAQEILREVNKLEYLEHRMALVNVWRPIIGPVYDCPLAICDPRTSSEEDFVQTDIYHFNEDDLETPAITGQIYSLRHNVSQRWYYCSAMKPEEVLLLRNWDSGVSDHSCYGAHTSFKNPIAPPQSKRRESIELRTLLIFP